MINIDELKFDPNGLIPAMVIDASTQMPLMLAYLNRESLELTIKEGQTCFYSRSRAQLWRKGETSGNTQRVVSITADCDKDALVINVIKQGPACHTGSESCFFNEVYADETLMPFSYEGLMQLIKGRKLDKIKDSYTSYLFEKGLDKILKKVGEESTEVIISAKAGDRANTLYEIADLAYHVMVLMVECGLELEDIKSELASRHVVDKKVKQEKMA